MDTRYLRMQTDDGDFQPRARLVLHNGVCQMRLLDVDEEESGIYNNAACLSNIGVLPDSEIAGKNWIYFRGI